MPTPASRPAKTDINRGTYRSNGEWRPRSTRNRENLRLKYISAGINRIALFLATTSHVLSWAAYLWIVFRPHAQRSVSTGPLGVAGNGAAERQVVVEYVTLTQVDGYLVLIPLFIPVLVTVLALLFMLTRKKRRTANALVIWSLTAILLVFCGLGYYGFGIFYLPAAITLTAAAVTFGTGRGLPGCSTP